jgi:hypothetical protein
MWKLRYYLTRCLLGIHLVSLVILADVLGVSSPTNTLITGFTTWPGFTLDLSRPCRTTIRDASVIFFGTYMDLG